ncbi:MAG TPA: hypothetical protein VHO70_07075 [Chitinispirillaceae bacterium]|nr:hypothetical protein [Chitinispirillaceae bacterium]
MRIKILFFIFIITSLLLALMVGMRFNSFRTIIDTLSLNLISGLVHKGQKENGKLVQSTSADTALRSIYSQLEIKPESVKRVFSPDDSLVSISAEIPKGKPMEWVIWVFSSSLSKTGYTIDNCIFISEERGCEMVFLSHKHSSPKLTIKIKTWKIVLFKNSQNSFYY